jgi:hypothetical protein
VPKIPRHNRWHPAIPRVATANPDVVIFGPALSITV